MDNVTHAIAGIVVAEAVVQARARLRGDVTPAFARTAWIVSALGHNAPDSDALYTWMFAPPLGYLLHHRGYTHTLALAPLLAALSYGIGVAFARADRARGALSRDDRWWLAALAIQGPIGHLFLDWTNVYGVHPFWPLYDGWVYGDWVFIVEPLFWAACIPMIVFATSSRIARIGFGLVLALGLALTWSIGLVPRPAALVAMVLAAIAIAFSARAKAAPRAAFAVGASAVVLGAFVAGSAIVTSSARAALAESDPGWELLDVARSPVPATPLCWNVIAVERSRDGARVALRLAMASAAPSLVSASSCALGRDTPGPMTATLAPGSVRTQAFVERGRLERPLSELRSFAARCDFAAYLRWSRFPFVASDPEGLVAGDLRYDQTARLDFDEMRMPARIAQCPTHVPPWTPPRTDLFGDPGR